MSKEVLRAEFTHVLNDDGYITYENQHGYTHCDHVGKKLHKISISWGNSVYVCDSCGSVAKKYTTSSL